MLVSTVEGLKGASGRILTVCLLAQTGSLKHDVETCFLFTRHNDAHSLHAKR